MRLIVSVSLFFPDSLYTDFMRTLCCLLLFCGGMAILAGCNDSPTSAGYSRIPPSDLVNVKTFDLRAAGAAFRTSSAPYDEPLSGAEILSLGAAQGYRAQILLRFLPLSAIAGDSVGGGVMREAALILHASPYAIGNINGTVAFDVMKITSTWSSFTFLPRTLDSIQVDPAAKGSFSGALTDTTLSVPIDTAMVREWLTLYKNGDAADIWGVLLKPRAESNVIRGFWSSEWSPSLEPSLRVVIERFGRLDTMTAFGTIDTHVMTGPAIPPAQFTCRGAAAQRGYFRCDLSAIPRNSVINAVTVELTLNRPASAFYYRGRDSLLLQEVTDTARMNLYPSGAIGVRLSSADIYTFTGSTSLIRAVQNWVIRPDLNYGFAVRAPREDSDPDIYAIFGAEADSTRRPRIVVTYTSQPL